MYLQCFYLLLPMTKISSITFSYFAKLHKQLAKFPLYQNICLLMIILAILPSEQTFINHLIQPYSNAVGCSCDRQSMRLPMLWMAYYRTAWNMRSKSGVVMTVNTKHQKRPPDFSGGLGFTGAIGASRTRDPLLRRQMLYPSELQPQLLISYHCCKGTIPMPQHTFIV